MIQDTSGTDNFIISDAVTELEARFPFAELLGAEYFQKYRSAYYNSESSASNTL